MAVASGSRETMDLTLSEDDNEPAQIDHKPKRIKLESSQNVVGAKGKERERIGREMKEKSKPVAGIKRELNSFSGSRKATGSVSSISPPKKIPKKEGIPQPKPTKLEPIILNPNFVLRHGGGKIVTINYDSSAPRSFFPKRDIVGEWKVRRAIVSTYEGELKFIEGLFGKGTSIVIVGQDAKNFVGKAKETVFHDSRGGGVLCRQHSKMLWIEYDDFARLVITSANLKEAAFRDQANVLWMQDFRRRPSPYTSGLDNISITPFISQLYKFLSKGLGLESHPLFLSSFLTHFDFTPNDNDVRLIWSVKPLPKSTGFVGASQNVEGGGMYVLAQAVKDLSHLRGGDWTIECGGSSLNKIDRTWMENMLAACSGIIPFATKEQTPISAKNVKLVFPTAAQNARTQSQARYSAAPFPEIGWQTNEGKFLESKERDVVPQLLHKSPSFGRPPNPKLVHSKSILILHTTPFDGPAEGFLYFGSHNMTIAAWGTVERASTLFDREAIRTKPNQAELGILFRLKGTTLAEIELDAARYLPYDRPVTPFDPAVDRMEKRERE